MADQNIRIGADVGSAISEIKSLTETFARETESLTRLLGVTARYNEIGNKTEVVLKGITREGKIFEGTYATADGVIRRITSSVNEASKAFAKLGKSQSTVSLKQRDFAKNEVQRIAGTQLGPIPADASSSSVDEFQKALNRVARISAGQTFKNPSNVFAKLLDDARKGILANADTLEGRLGRAILDADEKYKRLGQSAKRTQDAAKKAADEAAAALKRQASAAETASKSDELAKQFKADSLLIANTLRNSIGLDLTKLSPGKVAGLNAPIASIQALVAGQKIEADRVFELFSQIQAKQKLVFANPAEKAAASLLSTLISRQEAYNASLDVTKKKLDATTDATLRQQQAANAQAFLQQKFLVPTDADPKQIKRIQAAFNSSTNLVSSGKVNEDQFKNLFAAFQKSPNQIFGGIEGKVVNSFRTINQAINSTGTIVDLVNNKFNLLGLKLQSIGRLFLVQILHTALGQIISSLTQSTNKAAEFSKKITEIQTLSEAAGVSTKNWSSSLVELSNSFGIDVIDVANAAYDTLSNQVAKGTQAIAFLRTAAVFAKVTVSSLKDSVNLLSSAITAYSNQGLTATRASEVLFSIIDLGRVRAEEIGDTFGNVAVLASQLGVRFEELGGAIATLTVQGIRYDTSATLLNNIFLKLLKPTTEMNALFKTWGVNSGQAAVATFGFAGVIQKLFAELDSGGLQRIGELVGELRAVRGVISLGNADAVVKFGENIDDITAKAKERFEKAKAIIEQSPSFKFDKQIQEFKNFLTFNIGQNIFQEFIKLTDSIGGVGNALQVVGQLFNGAVTSILRFGQSVGAVATSVSTLANAFGGFSTILPLAVTAVGGLTTGFVVMLAKNFLLKSSLVSLAPAFLGAINRISTFVSAIGVGKSVLSSLSLAFDIHTASLTRTRIATTLLTGSKNLLFDSLVRIKGNLGVVAVGLGVLIGAYQAFQAQAQAAQIESIDNTNRIIEKQNQDLLARTKASLEAVNAETRKQMDTRLQIILQKNADINRKISAALDIQSPEERDAKKIIEDALSRQQINGDFDIAKAVKVLTGSDGQTIEDIGKSILKVRDNIISLERELAKGQFESKISVLDPIERTQVVLRRIHDLREQTQEFFDQGNLDAARNTFKDIQTLIQNSLAGKDGLRSAIASTKEQLDQLANLGKPTKTNDIFAQAAQLEGQGLKLLDLGNIKEALESFKQVDSLLNGIADKEAKLRRELGDLGVKLPTTSLKDDQTDLLNKRLAALRGAEGKTDLATKVLQQQIDLEKEFQTTQSNRFVIAQKQSELDQAQTQRVEQLKSSYEQVNAQYTKSLETQTEITSQIRTQVSEALKLITAQATAAGLVTRFTGALSGDGPSKAISDINKFNQAFNSFAVENHNFLDNIKNLSDVEREAKISEFGLQIADLGIKIREAKKGIVELAVANDPKKFIDNKTGLRKTPDQISASEIFAQDSNLGIIFDKLIKATEELGTARRKTEELSNLRDNITGQLNRLPAGAPQTITVPPIKTSDEATKEAIDGLLKSQNNSQELLDKINPPSGDVQELRDELKALDGLKTLPQDFQELLDKTSSIDFNIQGLSQAFQNASFTPQVRAGVNPTPVTNTNQVTNVTVGDVIVEVANTNEGPGVEAMAQALRRAISQGRVRI